MTLFLFSNRAITTLAGPISAGSTTANLAAGTGSQFPSPAAGQAFTLTFAPAAGGQANEVVWVTNRSGDVITMTRAQEGTTAQSWSAGDVASHFWTAGDATVMVQEAELQLQPGNYATASGTNTYSVTLSPAPASLTAIRGAPVRIQPASTNTGGSSLTVVGAGSAAIVNPDGSALAAGQLTAGFPYELIFNGSQFVLVGNAYAVLSRNNTWTGTQTFSGTVGAQQINATGVAVSGAITGGSGTIGGVGFTGGAVTATTGVVGGVTMSAGGITAAGINTTTGTIGGVAMSSTNITVPGNVSCTNQVSGGTIVSATGNITSAVRLRAALGATGSGDPLAATILSDFFTAVTGVNQFVSTRPDGMEFQAQLTNAASGGGSQQTVVTLPLTFSGGITSAIGCLNGNTPPGLTGTWAVQPGPGNKQVTVTTNFPGAVPGGNLGMTVWAWGIGPLT